MCFITAEKLAPLKLVEEKESDHDDDDEFIGPPIPKDLPTASSSDSKKDDDDSDDDETIGPLPSRQEPPGPDNSDDESEDEDEVCIRKAEKSKKNTIFSCFSRCRAKFLLLTKCKCSTARRLY